MTINLTYTKIDGSQTQLSFDEDVVEIDLSEHGIATIDLSPLSQCTSLEELTLSRNHLEEIDLTPLAACSSLKMLHLHENKLQRVDLTPLMSNPEVSLTKQDVLRMQKELILIDSHYQPDTSRMETVLTESLWDTAKDESLHIILRGPALQELARRKDPGVVPYCDKLLVSEDQECWFTAIEVLATLNTYEAVQKLFVVCDYSGTGDRMVVIHILGSILTDVYRERFRRILRSVINPGELDVTGWTKTALQVLRETCTQLGIAITYPGHSWTRKRNLAYGRPNVTEFWPFLRQIALKEQRNLRVQQDILVALGLGDFGFIDRDLGDVFLSISLGVPIESARELVLDAVIESMSTNVDNGEAATGLKLEDLQSQYTEIAKRIPDILRMRKDEMEKVVIKRKGNTVDLSELWLTAYGYEVLRSMNMKRSTDSVGLKKVKTSLSELGFDLRIEDASVSGVKMSDELKQVIWWIVDNEGKSWNEIEE